MVCVGAAGLQVLVLLLVFSAECGLTRAETPVTVRRVTHPPLRRPLSGSALLPCVFTLPSALLPGTGPFIRWSRGAGAQERTVLFARDGVVRVHRAYVGRVSLPGYSADPLNASLALSQLRSNDSGSFRCHIALGENYEQDTVNLEVTGVVFHYRSPTEHYSLSFAEAVRACEENSAEVATPEQLWAAFHSGMNSCAAGWLRDQSVRYPIQRPELGCYGHAEFSPGVRNYGKRDPSELFDVYCFARDMQGEVFPAGVPDGLTRPEAVAHCAALGGRLATVGQLYLAWSSGLDHCEPAWLSDGSVRFSISSLRSDCPAGGPGVQTVSPSELNNGTTRFDAFCYRGSQCCTNSCRFSVCFSVCHQHLHANVDECQSNPCENGGTCIDKEDSFVCLCLPSYSGDRCERDTEGCEHGWKKFHGHCYRLFPRRHTWEDAEKDCREHSSHLTSITSSMEQDFLNGLGHENVWIGLNDRTVEEDFQWTDAMDVVYENWRENQPDNFFAGGEDCVVMISREDGKWNDVPCNYNLPYVCKKGTVMCGTPPAVDNASLVGRRRSHYDIHAVVRYQCADGFFQRHIPTVRCRPDGTWERPKIICTKCESQNTDLLFDECEP
uniref:Uncharacterized protein n=1 Tax=Cyprinus carpio TaxID=7962 RepID=A0A8C1MT53_CYPCA